MCLQDHKTAFVQRSEVLQVHGTKTRRMPIHKTAFAQKLQSCNFDEGSWDRRAQTDGQERMIIFFIEIERLTVINAEAQERTRLDCKISPGPSSDTINFQKSTHFHIITVISLRGNPLNLYKKNSLLQDYLKFKFS